MDGVGVGQLGSADDGPGIEITLIAGAGPDADIFVREADVQRIAIRFGVNGHGGDAQFFAGADDAQGDFSAVGNEYLLEHDLSLGRFAERDWR